MSTLLFGGITSGQSEANGYANVVLPALCPQCIVPVEGSANATNASSLVMNATSAAANITNATYVQMINSSALAIHIPQLVAYDIGAPETLTVNINPLLVAFDSRPGNQPTFEIAASPGSAQVIIESEQLTTASIRRAGRGGGQLQQNLILLVLADDTWAPGIGSDCSLGEGASATLSLLSAFVSSAPSSSSSEASSGDYSRAMTALGRPSYTASTTSSGHG